MIIVIIYFFGYNIKYNNDSIFFILIFLSLGFSLIILFFPILEKIEGQNPGSFLLYPLKKIKYIILNIFCYSFLIGLMCFIFAISNFLSENRKYRFLNSSNVNITEGRINKIDTVMIRSGKKPVAYLNYKVAKKIYDFELLNKNRKYILNQKVKLKYSLEHPDMFEVLE